MREPIKLVDDDGMYTYSHMYRTTGKNLHVTTGGLGSIAGTPKVIGVMILWPNIVATNSAKRIDPDKEYDIIIIEKEERK